MITISLFIVGFLLSVYAWLATVEFGISLLQLLPKLNTGKLSRLFTPRWELANIFLVLGLIAFAIAFNTSLSDVARDVLSTLIIGAAALTLRIGTVFYLLSHKKDRQQNPRAVAIANGLFALASCMVPASLAAIGIYFLIGQAFWITASGWVLMALALALIAALALSFIYWQAGTRASLRLQWASRIAIAVFAAIAALIAQLIIRDDSPHLLSAPFAVFVLLVACTLLWQGALFTTKRADHGMWWYLSVVALATPILLALANQPWLVYGQYLLAH